MSPWERRALRARFLAEGFASAREILTFYAQLADWQGQVAPRVSRFMDVVGVLPSLLEAVERTAPTALVQAAREFDLSSADALLRDHWEARVTHSIADFFAHAALQPHAAGLPEGLDCPWCAQPPQAGVLRSQGDGLAFELVCALCLRRRSFPRSRCPRCQESSESLIATYTAEGFPHMRLLTCDGCKGYLHVIDLERDVTAIPEVDELSAVPLDLWAVQQGYHKLQPNLAGV